MGKKPVKKFRSSVKHAAKKAWLHDDFCLYELRHLFATTLLTKGADLAAVSQLLGHASTSITTDVYYSYLEGEKERATGLLPSLEEKSAEEAEAQETAQEEEEKDEDAASKKVGKVLKFKQEVTGNA